MKSTRISKKSDFANLSKCGRKKYFGCISGVFFKTLSGSGTKIAYAVSKKTGNAVTRNKIKRRLRSISTEYLKSNTPKDYNILFIARKEAATIEFAQLSVSVNKFFMSLR